MTEPMTPDALEVLIAEKLIEQGRKQASGLVLILDEFHIRRIVADALAALRGQPVEAYCALCDMTWRGPYVDCPGCQAQAAMKGIADLPQEPMTSKPTKDEPMTPDSEEALEAVQMRLNGFIRAHQTGGCKVLSRGCLCPLCDVARLAALRTQPDEIARLTERAKHTTAEPGNVVCSRCLAHVSELSPLWCAACHAAKPVEEREVFVNPLKEAARQASNALRPTLSTPGLEAEVARLTALVGTPAPSGWLPIATAPKDGQFLVFWQQSLMGGPPHVDMVGSLVEYNEIRSFGEPEAIAWHPLPVPPEGPTGEPR